MAYQRYEMDLAGRQLVVETGHIAEQANGAVLMRQGETVVLVTAVANATPREGIDFFPLTCDYEEKIYATGRIPGSFIRRESRPAEAAILASRMIDRPMRPLFPKDFRNDVQITATVLSVDFENDPATLAVNGASLALLISNIPHSGPVGCVRIGLIDGELVVNPLLMDLEHSDLDLVVAGTDDAITMVEAGARQVPEDIMLKALRLAHEHIRKLVAFQLDVRTKMGPKVLMDYPHMAVPEELQTAVHEAVEGKMFEAAYTKEKTARERALSELQKSVEQQLAERFPEAKGDIGKAFEKELKKTVRKAILEKGLRPDGRATDEIRPIWCKVGVLPRTHGSAIFTRGQTQALTIATLGSESDAQKLDGLGLQEFKRYMHHYNFPGFSVGEAKAARSPGRREIGHGALAERAVHNVMPPDDEFPYVVRVVTEILSSNGSTSMASVCGSTLSLMDAGVPLLAPVAGIAMGLITEEGSDKAAILSDIQGMEDALGDMDFKVAGTEKGITALQMDIKIAGLKWELLETALAQARVGRLHILNIMLETLSAPRPELNQWAPRIDTIKINPDKIRDVIGSGGKTIRGIIDATGCQIDISDDGSVAISSNNPDARSRAIEIIRELTDDIEIGRIYKGHVTRLTNFGAFVEILPRKEGLVRIGNLAEHHVARVEDVVNVGDEIMVKVIEVDDRGRVNLSRKDALRDLSHAHSGDSHDHNEHDHHHEHEHDREEEPTSHR
ncbi:MAG: polyribonucleotide nucleotidyltransferase [Candidatus Dormibacteria bacterium]